MTEPISNLLNLTGKTAIVTGGAVGIGGAISQRLAEAGAHVVIADVSASNLDIAQKALQSYGSAVTYCEVDVANTQDIKKLIKTTKEKQGSIDILVNNAGIFPNAPLMELEEGLFEKVVDINLKGVYLATKAVAEAMIDDGKGGKIINITSIDALHPSMVGLSHYDASKHGVWGFTKNVALELAPHNITVNAVAPGGISTPGVQALQSTAKAPAGVDMEAVIASFLATIPMRRMGDPDDIAKSVLFLASDLSSYTTGSQLVVDGGALLS